MGALLIGFGKRRNELVLAGENGPAEERRVLRDYSVKVLDQLIAVVAPATLVAYILYSFSAPGLPDDHTMMLTIPLVAYGLFRYLYLVYHRNLGETPWWPLRRWWPTSSTASARPACPTTIR